MKDLNALSLSDLFRALTDDVAFVRLLDSSLREDLGHQGDVTTLSIVDPNQEAQGSIVTRSPGVAAGVSLIPQLVHRLDPKLIFQASIEDGSMFSSGQSIGLLSGSLASMLMVERTLLNFLGRLSGIATLTSTYVETISDTGAVICDTRKTTPGLRHVEKYAVRCGGGTLHRLGLHDAALYKDNHLAAYSEAILADVLMRAIEKARAEHDLQFVEVEVDTLEQFDQVLSLPDSMVDIVLLDNMPPEMLCQAVQKRDACNSRIKLEASGGVTLQTVRDIAETGVDRISVGALTHSAPYLDVALDINP
ncbi:MAG: carboxylating nicotinate-nucleotide diphosphorylase [Planctomycetota bacterium]|nr:carboxylating nicotinate-nucleotide diphosphorylase [Planctomycetota bacterium]